MAFTMLRRRIADEWRRLSVRDRHESELAARSELAGATPGFNDKGFRTAAVGVWSVDPSQVATSREFWDDFAASVDRLPPKQRQAFCLKELDGEATEAVCDFLNVKPPALWGLLHRARLRLRAELAHHFGDGPVDEGMEGDRKRS